MPPSCNRTSRGSFSPTALLLPPTNFTINVTGLAQVLLRWEPNPHQEPGNVELGYRVRINAPQEEDVSIYSDSRLYSESILTLTAFSPANELLSHPTPRQTYGLKGFLLDSEQSRVPVEMTVNYCQACC